MLASIKLGRNIPGGRFSPFVFPPLAHLLPKGPNQVLGGHGGAGDSWGDSFAKDWK